MTADPPIFTRDALFVALATFRDDEFQHLLSGDPARAAPWVRAAAECGLVGGQVRFGRMLLEGEGIPADPAAALQWFEVAARDQDPDAMNMIGRCLENGWGTAVDLPAAADWYGKAAAAGSDWAQYNLGHLYLEGRGVAKDHGLALRWYLEAAGQGHPRAMNLAARCCEEGWGTPQDPAAAAAWYRKSAEGGYFRGQYNYATLLAKAGNTAAAALWLRKAANGGPLAMTRTVAQMLLANGPPLWDGLGLEILELCCRRGDAEDCYRLGLVLANGLHGARDPAAAVQWLSRAARHGHAAAASVLSRLHNTPPFMRIQDTGEARS